MNKKIFIFGLCILVFASFVCATQPLNSAGSYNQTVAPDLYTNSTEYYVDAPALPMLYYSGTDQTIYTINDKYINSVGFQHKSGGASTQYSRVYFYYSDSTVSSSEVSVFNNVYKTENVSNPFPNKAIDYIEIKGYNPSGNAGNIKDISILIYPFTNGLSYETVFDFQTIEATSDGCEINVSKDGVTYYPVNATNNYTFSTFTNIVYINLNDTESCSWFNLQAYDFAEYTKTLELIDEATNGPFLINETNSTSATFLCQDIGSYSFEITENNQNISIPCIYSKITVAATYDDTSYSRTILENFNESDEPVYMLDLTTTQALYNALIVNDYVGEYNNPQLYIKKNIDGAQVVVHSDDLDVENKISVYLIENDKYILELHSDNNPVNVLGFYGADITGTKEITVTSANIDTGEPENIGNGVTIYTYTINVSDETYAYGLFNDTYDETTDITWNLFLLNQTDKSLIDVYDVTISGTYGEVKFTPYNITEYDNQTIISVFTYTKDGEDYTYYKQITSENSDITENSMFSYFTGEALQWGVMIFLSVVSLSGTITTQNYVNYIIIGAAALGAIFNLLTISIVLLMFALAINFMFQMKNSESTRISR